MKKRDGKAIAILTLIILAAGFGIYLVRNSTRSTLLALKQPVQPHFRSYAELRDGDLIFQISRSSQSKAIQLATKSKYSHCGIVYKQGSRFYVFEAVQPVKRTPLEKWIARGQGGHFVVKRLKNADQILTSAVSNKMRRVGEEFMGKDYDLTFEWSDDKIYCSELIWKIYQRATGLEIGKPEKLGAFDLSHEQVQKKMKERYGAEIPVDETVISPAAIFNSELLKTVPVR